MKFFYTGNLLILLFGIAHLLLHFITLYIIGISKTEVYLNMGDLCLNLFGTQRSLSELMEGFSLAMGCFMVFYGEINLILYKRAKTVFTKVPLLFLWNGGICFIVSILSLLYFPLISFLVFVFSSGINFALYIRAKRGTVNIN